MQLYICSNSKWMVSMTSNVILIGEAIVCTAFLLIAQKLPLYGKCLHVVFSPLLECALKEFVYYWNTHEIRKTWADF